MKWLYVILVDDGWGEGTRAAGVFTSQPTIEQMAEAKRLQGGQNVHWERFEPDRVMVWSASGR